jgi:hypothetical protein
MMEKRSQDKAPGIQVGDIIQVCCLNMLTGVCSVVKDGFKGELFIRQGEIVDAKAGGSEGEEAFYSILSHPDGEIEFREIPHSAERTINKPWEHLLMEASRRLDMKGFRLSQSAFLAVDPIPSRVYIHVKRLPATAVDEKGNRSRKVSVPGLIKKKDATEECIIDSISSEVVCLRSLGTFHVGEKFWLTFRLPPRNEEVNVLVEVTTFNLDSISLEVRFVSPTEHARKLVGFYLWNP